jgi:multiple sugar transport system permease protein
MPIIPTVGRRSLKARAVFLLIYGFLSVGALTILYPFCLMLSSSVTNRMDYNKFHLLPLALQGEASRFVRFLGDRYAAGEWSLFRSSYTGIEAKSWDDIASKPNDFLKQSGLNTPDPERMRKYEAFLATLPPQDFGLHHFKRNKDAYFAQVVEPLFTKLGPKQIAGELPDNSAISGRNWTPSDSPSFQRVLDFKKSRPIDERFAATGQSIWLNWLKEEWSVIRLNAALGTNYKTLEDVPFLLPQLRAAFFEKAVPTRWNGQLPEMWYARFLNSSKEWEALPMAEYDYWQFSKEPLKMFFDALLENYRQVVFYLFNKGHAAINTIILIALSLLTALTVNPLAAYVLSRFRLAATPSILLFCLATAAFPAEVSMIPSFLLLRDLGMLNTFAALVLPGAANGFSIFLLKGFFDSLPKELYEAAEIDGAGEIRKFLTITMPLSAPILAVTALGAFTGAYTGYMWAFVVCQDERLWTLMVWLFQFQQEQNIAQTPSVGMAALVVASIPTLLIFLFCQKIILRGIILPSMK